MSKPDTEDICIKMVIAHPAMLHRGRGEIQNPLACVQCVTYWRWLNAEKTEGYCAAGGKPEF